MAVEAGVLECEQPGGEHVAAVTLDHMVEGDVVGDAIVGEQPPPEGVRLAEQGVSVIMVGPGLPHDRGQPRGRHRSS